MTISSIGTTARDYSTIALWWADADATLTAPWEGECYNDTEFTTTATTTLSGVATDATNFAALRPATGEGFADHADKLTNALRYNVANGVGLRKTNIYGTALNINCQNFTLSGMQVKGRNTVVGLNIGNASEDSVAIDCIIESGDDNVGVAISETSFKLINSVVVLAEDATTTTVGVYLQYAAPELINCTIISLVAGHADFGIEKQGGTPDNSVVKNCAIFGFGTAMESGTWGAGTDYNATDDTTLPAGSNNQTSLTFADQFENVAGISTLDLRNQTTADLVGAGIRDAANTNDLDILGQSRVTTPTGQTIGATEFAAAGGVTVNATLGTVSITGFDTTVTSTTLINSTLGTINIAGFNATVSTGVDVSATLGEINITGYNATVDLGGTTITATLGEISIAGFNPGISAGTDITATLGAVSIQGFNATVSQPTDIAATLGTINIAGYNPVISATTTISATLGLISITGFDTIVTNPTPGAPPSNKRILYINATKRTIDIKKTKRTITIS